MASAIEPDLGMKHTKSACGNRPPSKPFYGPWLRLQGFDLEDKVWTLSVLVVAPVQYNTEQPPQVDVDGHGDFPAVKLETFNGWNFWRFEFGVELDAQERRHTYTLDFTPALPGKTEYAFVAPALGKPLRWGFKSCDWFSGCVKDETRASMGGHKPVFNDILACHAAGPLHMMVGGGDQLYCDPVFLQVPELIEWAKFSRVRDVRAAKAAQASEALKSNVSEWYFNHYMASFGMEGITDVMAAIPHAMMFDDHDIFDGWGSYPHSLQSCPVFQAVYQVAERFYLLFQQHTTKAHAYKEHDFFGPDAYHYLKLLSPESAILGMDMRTKRTLKHVVTQQSYDAIFKELSKLPPSVKHLVVISAVPVVYPEVPFSERSLKMLGFVNKHSFLWACMKKKDATGGLFKFDEPELLDDLIDHWGSSVHKRERKAMIQMFQAFARSRGVRVSFISGDVHLAAVGLLYGRPKVEDPADDPRWMVNVTSSASVNVPPPNALVQIMTKSNKAHNIDSHTKEKMVRMFADAGGQSDKLMPARNWCSVINYPTSMGGNMVFTLRIEPPGSSEVKEGFKQYSITAPLIKAPPTATS